LCIAVAEAFGTYVAQVAEVTVARNGDIKVDRVVCAVDCGTPINPDVITAQMEGGIGFGLGAALYGAPSRLDHQSALSPRGTTGSTLITICAMESNRRAETPISGLGAREPGPGGSGTR
jgi:hypothetical protein